MADNAQNIIQNLIIRIQEDLKNANKAIDHLKNVQGAAGAAQKNINAYSSAASASVKTMGMMAKAAYNLGSAIKAVTAPLSIVTDAIKVLALAGTGLSVMMADAGKELTVFAAMSGKGADATNKLRASYQDLVMSGQKAVITIKDLSVAMTEFGKQGFAQLQMASQKPMQDFVGGLQNALTQGLGSKEMGAQLTQTVTQAFGNNLNALRSFRDEWISAGQDMVAQQDVLAKFRWVDDTVMTNAIGAIQNLRDRAAGLADPAVAANLSWSEFGNQLLVLFNQVQQEITMAFGTDTSGLIEKFGDYVKDASKWVQGAWKELKIFGAIGKVVWNWVSESAIISFSLIQSGFLKLISAMMSGFSKVSRFFGFEDVAKRAAEAAANAAADAKTAFDRAMSPKYLSMTDEIVKAQQENKRIIEQAKQPIQATQKSYDFISKLINTIGDKLLPIIQESENWKISLDSASKSFDTISKIIELTGNQVSIVDQRLGGMVRGSFKDVIDSSKKLLDESKKGLVFTDMRLFLARLRGDQQQINKFIGEQEQLLGQVLHAHTAIKNAQDQSLSSNKANLTELQAITALQQSHLEISKALYGTPALGVEALRNIVELTQKEKEQIQEMLKIQRENIDIMVAQGIEGDQLLNAKKLELDLQKQIADKTVQQLNMLKELRDGYLDAVQASAFSAGKFEKIIISQEKNVAMALDKNIAKRNYLLGQTGSDARASNRMPVRFSDSGIGALQGMDGQDLSGDQLRKYSEDAINNIGDPGARAAAKQSLDAMSSIYKGVQGAQVKANVDNTQATQQNTDAINALITARSGALPMKALNGTPAGSVAIGESIRRLMGPSGASPINAGNQDSFFKKSSQGLVNGNLMPIGPKGARELEKVRNKNAKSLSKKQNSVSNFNKQVRDLMRGHWEAHNKNWEHIIKQGRAAEGLSSLDTIARRGNNGSFEPETKSGYTLSHGKKKNSGGGGGNNSRLINNVASALLNAIDGLKKLGPVMDDLDTKDNPVSRSPPGGFGNSGAP